MQALFYLAYCLNNRLKPSSKSPALINHQEITVYFFIRISFVAYTSALEKAIA